MERVTLRKKATQGCRLQPSPLQGDMSRVGGDPGLRGKMIEQLGSRRPLILQDAAVAEGSLGDVAGALRVDFGGECPAGEIDRVSELARDGTADAMLAANAYGRRRWRERRSTPC